ncbi:MAG TPA: glycerol-3-phosphate 1-O-acyltransferase PlsY [Acidimicrobiales bacterium]|nr:glycerol-3-phosphate 1-O-acyltransferase PlsY [Acidimicrobiales bacterium]
MALAAVAAVVAAYALGTFPTATVVAGKQVTQEGSGNPGASNVYRLAGRRAGLLVFGGDFFKGAVATGAGLALGGRALALACGAAAVVGHCFPVTRRFKGGKGVATAGGFVLVIEPVVALVAAVVWLAVVKLTKRASVASLVIALGIPTAVLVLRGPGTESAVVVAVAALIVARHADNVARLMRREERTVR